MTDPLVRPESGGAWTIEDLQRLPDDGFRYELTDGSLLVSPPPALPHFRVTTRLRRLLEGQAPSTLIVGENVGTGIDRDPRRTTLRVPDLTVLHAAAVDRDDVALDPADIVLVVEVLSPDRAGYDVITKRHQYGNAGIPHYWIVDPKQRTLTALPRGTTTSRPSCQARLGTPTSRSHSRSIRPNSYRRLRYRRRLWTAIDTRVRWPCG